LAERAFSESATQCPDEKGVVAAGGEVELPSGVQQVALFSDSYRCSEEECVLDEHCHLPDDDDEPAGLLDWLLSGWRYQGLSG